jgi:hypothetical protein
MSEPVQQRNQNHHEYPNQLNQPNQAGQPSQPYAAQPNYYRTPPPAYQNRAAGYSPSQPQPPVNYAPAQYPPGTWSQAGPYAAAPVQAKKQDNRFLYLLPALGVAALALGVFLPWFSVAVLGSTVSLNGLGNASGPTELTGIFAQGNAVKDGVIVLALAGLLGLLTLGGLALKARGFAIAVLVFGLAAAGLMAFELVDANRNIAEINRNAAGAAVAQTGLGLYIGLAGAVIVLLGALITFIFFRKK